MNFEEGKIDYERGNSDFEERNNGFERGNSNSEMRSKDFEERNSNSEIVTQCHTVNTQSNTMQNKNIKTLWNPVLTL